jgi:N6-adenosine-specific RNA methylase IME4
MNRTIVADPPWPFRDRLPGPGRGAVRHYPSMTLEALSALPVGSRAAADAHLYVWCTNTHLREGLDLVAAWGFRYKTMLTWIKTGRLGMGHYYRGNTEHVLFAARGRLPVLRHDLQNHFTAPASGQHSAKPEAFYDLVELMSPAPRLELFARRQRLGWDTWGNECFTASGLRELTADS